MKKIVLLFVVFALVSFRVADSELTADERKLGVDRLTQSYDHMVKVIAGLTPAQLNYKSSATSWSVAECAEHIAITESSIWGMVEGALKQPADPSKRGEVKMTDDVLVNMMTDRSSKFKTQEMCEPKQKFGSFDGSVKEFKEKRKAHIEYIKSTKDDLRNRYAVAPFGTIDAFQAVLFLAAHSERHTKQMEEVIASAGFPKK